MAENKFDWKMFLITIFLGWFGVDKFYKGGLKGWKHFLIKFGFTLIFIGIVWNIFDLVQICRGKYQFDAREYFR